MDIWNTLIKIRDTNTNPEIKDMADRILGQLNTASGSVTMKKEAEMFIYKVSCISKGTKP